MDGLRGLAGRAGDTHGAVDHVPGVIGMHWISRLFVSAALRRVAALLVFIVAAWLGIGSAQAKMFPDQGSAYAACRSDAAEHRVKSGKELSQDCVFWPNDRQYVCRGSSYQGSQVVGCNYDAGGPTWYDYPAGTSCSSRSSLGSGVVGGTGSFDGKSTCDNGCTFSGGTHAGVTVTMGGKTWGLTDGMTPTGSVCTSGEVGGPKPVTEDDCVPQGTLTQCVKPDGRVCTKASTGKMFCYGTTENGAKSSGNEATVITPDGVESKPPSTPPANGGEWVKAGEGSITTTDKNGNTVTKNVTTYVSNYGTQGSNSGAEGDKGKEDGEDEGPTASTGVGCDAPSFQCSDMSSVECNQLIQTWYLRCKGKQINGGANCDAPPQCEGNSTDCFIGLQLWQFRCDGKDAVLADGASGDQFDQQSASDGDGTDEPDALHMPGNGNTADMGIWEEKTVGGPEDLLKLDATGFLGGSGTCPQLPRVSIGASSLSLNLNPICDLLRNVGIMVMALAYWLAYRIIAKVR